MGTQQKTRVVDGAVVTSRMGGWRGSPASLANLDAGRIPWPLLRSCARCGRPAMRGRSWCQAHDAQGVKNAGPGRIAARVLDAMGKNGLLPAALVQLDVWQALARTGMNTRAPAQLALVLAWATRDQDVGRWSSVWRAALGAVRDHAASSR